MNYRIPLVTATALSAFACGGDAPNTNNATGQRPIQCRSADYVAFDVTNHTNQTLRIQAYVDMVTTMKAAESAEPFDATVAATNFAEAQRLYQETASLQEKVKGRTDDHFDDRPVVGAAIDAAIAAALTQGANATTGLEATLARQTVDKQLVHFFYLSVFHEMQLGQRGKWDEAFGYVGMASDNAESERKALAAVATSRDATNNTDYANRIFNGLIDGACALTEALHSGNVEEVNMQSVPALKAAVDAVDADLQRVFAFSAGHEAFEMAGIRATLLTNPTDELKSDMWIKLSELDPYFQPLERLMLRKGGEPEMRAMMIRAAIDAAWASSNDDWMTSFEAQAIVQALEAEFNIDIKG